MAAPEWENLHAVMLAGGKGERFWPASTNHCPKPFIREWFGQTLFRITFDRIREYLSPSQIWLVIGEQHLDRIHEEAPEILPNHLLLEPMGRDTAAAITYSAMALKKEVGPEALMLVVPCDHYVQTTEQFWSTIRDSIQVLQEFPEQLLVLGIPPTRVETGYGFLEVAEPMISKTGVYRYPVKRFHEKPDQNRAFQYFQSNHHYWNSGMFLWRVSRILELIQEHLPKLYSELSHAFRFWQDSAFSEKLRSIYDNIEAISIDYGVMEKAQTITMLPASFSWDDIGNWDALDRVFIPDDHRNRSIGKVYFADTTDTTVITDRGRVLTVGIEGVIVVRSGDDLLLIKKGRAGELKKWLKNIPDTGKDT